MLLMVIALKIYIDVRTHIREHSVVVRKLPRQEIMMSGLKCIGALERALPDPRHLLQ